MTTLAHRLSNWLPNPFQNWLRPKWHATREIYTLLVKLGGTVRNNKDLSCWVITRPIGKKTLVAPARSIREFRRIVRFGENPDDLVFHWINMITDCDVLYDVGAANGHEGLSVQLLHGSHVVYIEMFTPSIETILKGTVLASQNGAKIEDFDVIAAACDRTEGYARVLLHNLPVAGGTFNSFSDLSAYCRGGREDEPVLASQWSPSITIDCLHKKYQLPKPTHVKMDIDGFEDRAIEGAKETLASRVVHSWIIEINPGRKPSVDSAMLANGYKDIAHFIHYEGIDDAEDHLYVRDDLVDDYQRRLKNIRNELRDNVGYVK